jgi:hypothetical protein
MRGEVCKQLNYLWLSLILLFCCAVSRAQPGCDNDRQHLTGSGAPSLSLPRSTSSYHILRVQSDRVLGKRWAMMVDSDHPEWPAFALPLQGCEQVAGPQRPQQTSSSNIQAPPMVHAGDIVRVWRQERFLRLEVAAISEENGRLGQRIRMRLSPLDGQILASPEQVSGLVRGPSSVEWQP